MPTATSIVSGALRKGVLKRKPCAVCGKLKVQAHHPDYDYPLRVVWLCRKHHSAEHVRMRAAGESAGFSGEITLTFDKPVLKKLRELAKRERRTISAQIEFMIEPYTVSLQQQN
jgi:hypothetical protein